MNKIEQQMLAAGLENLGPVEHLSHWPRLLQESPLMQDFTPAEADILGSVMLRVRARAGRSTARTRRVHAALSSRAQVIE